METNRASGGTGIATLLQIAFIVLKLCGVINWNWWWVLSPTWILAILAVIYIAIFIWLIK